ncbi:uncharacterized protein LOC109835292 [Asparagus officinalis]|uniref:uncharacterized protein LOC109835292 n=1 Tax=Asparagus officinalis TaxID=4686 RepID=UPI00098E3CA8|nr:uncharacterized protein LOC109835292 [Asparagus officinalis]
MGHRKFLKPSHPYRRKKSWFDNSVEHGSKPRALTCHNISAVLNDFPNDFGKGGDKKRKRNNNENDGDDDEDEDDTSDIDNQNELTRWKKRSIFFSLPYWKELLLRYNLDVMHIEKNICESIISTMLHSGKSKDGINARKDLEDIGIRKGLHPEQRGSRLYLPPAPHTFSRSEKKRFCKRLYDFKGPDGYCSNIGNCITLEDCKIMGLKSHDYHVLMQQLLAVAIRGLLPKEPRKAILRLSRFFNRLCQRAIDREKLLDLENEIIETLCQLERFFPPSFFDIMVHLPVHLAREARLCGPVHFHWMYPFERYMKTLKKCVRNPARPEGCIAESYLAEECIAFCSEFLKQSIHVKEKEVRNEEFENDVIFEGRPISKTTSITLTDKEKDIAHRSVLLNTAIMDPFLDMHLEELQAKYKQLEKNQTLLWKRHTEKIAEWTKNKIPIDSNDHSKTLRWLAYGPKKSALSCKGYIINGLRFHTKDVDRETQNSGVTYDAITMCRASAKDTAQVADLVSYYGILIDIILLDYHLFYVPLFKCHWVNKGNGVKEEDGFTLVNL